ncbi:helix-turn-helix domain-containing protein [Luteimonas suaedae]|uniref:helix-turn-helix domain-containing protein n=1 Tax=Luteimonas suaedae TaxID=2605430 RepID=UPI0011EF1DE7|nr:AraC family transcriptional regulator [Luteimonas suaedae]
MPESLFVRRVEPMAQDWRHYAWPGGAFDSGRRKFTADVEGRIHVPHALLLVTLGGGARTLEVTTECGHRYVGADFSGSISFLPAGCPRRMAMRDVQAAWATVSLRPRLLDQFASPEGGTRVDIPAFTNVRDPLLAQLVAELSREVSENATPESDYCDALTTTIARVLAHRYAAAPAMARAPAHALPPWQIRRLREYVDAHLSQRILVADLAMVAGISMGHLHRAFRASLGETPHAFIQKRRVERARRLLAEGSLSIFEVAASVGFESPSHFSRVFRTIMKVSPSRFRYGA